MDDEIRSVVIDGGSGSWKVGMTGEKTPRTAFPPVVGRVRPSPVYIGFPLQDSYVGHEAMVYADVITAKSFYDNGIVCNWDDAERAWHKAFYLDLQIAPEEHPVLLTEHLLMPKANKEKMTQIMFETFNTPALFIEAPSVLDFYAVDHGLTCLIVNLGHGTNEILPVVEGFSLKHMATTSRTAGEFVTNALKTMLASENNFTPSSCYQREYINQMKEDLAYVALDYSKEIQLYDNHKTLYPTLTEQNINAGFISYDLPDGRSTMLGSARFRCTEAYFQPALFSIDAPSLVDKIMECVMKCDIDIRKPLLQNIVLTGGASATPGLVDRLGAELSLLTTYPPKLFPHPLGSLTSWLGGSILTEMPSFMTQWTSKEEYDESGPSICGRRKCW